MLKEWLARWTWLWMEPEGAPVWSGFAAIPTRSAEILLSCMMFSIGVTLVAPGDTFALPHWKVMGAWVSETTLGWQLIVIGMARFVAIVSDIRVRISPILRIVGCCAGAGFWATVFIAIEEASSMWVNGPPTLLAIAVSCTLFESYAAMRGGTDAANLDSLGFRERAWKAKRRNDPSP